MQYYKNYHGHEANICGKNKKFDNTIYTFDIETTSYYILDDKIYIGESFDLANRWKEHMDLSLFLLLCDLKYFPFVSIYYHRCTLMSIHFVKIYYDFGRSFGIIVKTNTVVIHTCR